LKFLQPEIKFDYLDTTLSTKGTKETSIKALYSIHFSLVNHQNQDVMSYLATYGYTNWRFPFDDIGSDRLSNAFFYRDPLDTRTADIEEGITAMETMVSDSNGISGGSKVTWEDDNGTHYNIKDYVDDAKERCDCIYINNIDVPGLGNRDYYCDDYDDKTSHWNALKTEYTIFWNQDVGIKRPPINSMETLNMGAGLKHSSAGYDDKLNVEDYVMGDVTSNEC
jgi:hypothetical protein